MIGVGLLERLEVGNVGWLDVEGLMVGGLEGLEIGVGKVGG
jgi:hypothetical protein